MLDYNALFTKTNNNETENTSKSFIEGCQKLDSDSLIRCGKPVHLIEVNYWEYNKKECVSVKFREFEGYFYNAGMKLKEFVDLIKLACDNDVDKLNEELRVNPPAMKFSKVKTKSGFWCIIPEIINEVAPF